MERQLRKTKEKAIERGKWQGRGGPRGSYRVSENLPSGYDSDMDFPKDRKASTHKSLRCHTAVRRQYQRPCDRKRSMCMTQLLTVLC